jgi:phosphoglycerate dehydrogenase-like enzyme
MPGHVIISEHLDDDPADWLAERHDVRRVRHDDAAFGEALADAAGLVVRTYTQVDDALLDRAPHLKVVGRAGVGLDNIDVAACRARGVEVVYTPDANTQAVVEYVIGLMLDAFRPRTDLPGPPEASPDRFHQLRQTEVGRQLDQLTLGILGLGRVGKRLGAVAHTIGMNLIACDLMPEADLNKAVDYPFDYVDHAMLYRGCDVLSVHVDGRAGNRGLIDAAALGAMRPDVLLINTSRGMVVDPRALADWARQHPAGRAVLDVHDPEPPPADPADDPLAGLANVRRLPHLASRTHTAMRNMSWVVRDVDAVLRGEAPRAPAPPAERGG